MLGMYSKVTKPDVMLRDEIVEDKRKHRDACPAKSSSWQWHVFKMVKEEKTQFAKQIDLRILKNRYHNP